MYLCEEISNVASELNEKAGVLGVGTLKTGSRLIRIVLKRHASQNIEKSEGEEPLVLEKRHAYGL